MIPLLALLMTSLVLMGSPGPSTISATAVGAAFGFRRALPYVGGLVLGTIAVLVAVAAGITTVLLAVPHAGPVLAVISALYILHLAWRIATAPPLDAAGDAAAPLFSGGLLLAVANPKAWLAFTALLAGPAITSGGAVAEAVAKTALLAAMVVPIHLLWLLAGAALSRFLHDPRASRIANVVAGILVAASALAMLR